MRCAYCEDKRCGCGGRRKVTSQPKRGDGEVKIQCQRCGATWLHWHVKSRGIAKEI